ncbi:hypothetical protein [Stieleria varia]|uniref:Uncharacterized protein n=1 Tax=Stieleria varia TaxID=2528005 RepID=A0A5C6AFZ9_9BACT|nr:hypothetical protein [Stieleria varia]TWT98238.1 hypothetical protein Pla52n_47480 [Stieleria varia]
MNLPAFHVHLSAGRRASDEMSLSFEEAQQRLSELERLYFEPDGSFVWAGAGFQVFGMLYDAAGKLQYVELRGKCTLAAWRRLIECFVTINAAGQKSTIVVMVLPERQWQELQTFESLFIA